MPNYQGHLIGGAVTYGLVLGGLTAFHKTPSFHFEDLIIWMVMCLLGSLFPDIDIRSQGQKIFYRFLLILTLIIFVTKKWEILSLITLAALFPMFVSHRGVMHSVWFIVTIPFLGVVALSYYDTGLINPASSCYLFFVAGAMSHLFLDFFPKKKFKMLSFKKFKKRF